MSSTRRGIKYEAIAAAIIARACRGRGLGGHTPDDGGLKLQLTARVVRAKNARIAAPDDDDDDDEDDKNEDDGAVTRSFDLLVTGLPLDCLNGYGRMMAPKYAIEVWMSAMEQRLSNLSEDFATDFPAERCTPDSFVKCEEWMLAMETKYSE